MELIHSKAQSSRRNDVLEPNLSALKPPTTPGKTYQGVTREDGISEVWIHESANRDGEARPLPLHLSLRNHSPTGFAWGYGGSGPAQLALALLMDATGDKELALQHYQEFKWRFVAAWEQSWSITEKEIRGFILEQTTPRRNS